MTEEKWVLDTPDGFKIHGLINRSDKKNNDKAVIHIHGLTGSPSGYTGVRMALTFPKHGYDVIRVGLYGTQEKARSLFDCTIKQHGVDIDLVSKYFSKKYKKLFATGHSYGGPSILTAKTSQFDAISLWDPTYLPGDCLKKEDFIKSGKYYISIAGVPLVVSKEFLDEAENFNKDFARNLAAKCKTPLQVIYAEFWKRYEESFHTHAKGLTEEKYIPSSWHAFYEEGTTEPLLRYTRKWFDRF